EGGDARPERTTLRELSRGLSPGDLARRIRAPLAPGAGIEPGAREPGDLHGEQVVAGRHARAALMQDRSGMAPGEQPLELVPQLGGGLERAGRIEILAVGAVARAG